MNKNLITFKNSILENSKEPLDFYSPVSFSTWLEQKNSGGADVDILFKNYNNYIIEWGIFKKKTKVETKELIRDSYIQVLRDLVINYSTEEEKRFITNADFSDPYDLDIILSFFVNKLKTICLFYSDQRELLKTATIQHNLKGSNLGIETFVKKAIFDAINTNQLDFSTESTTVKFPPVSAVAQNISVYVEELYDTYTDYFNINPNGSTLQSKNTSTNRKELSSINIIGDNDPYLYLNLKESIKDAILQYDFYVDSLGVNNFLINPILSGTELQYLKNRDFIAYLSGGTQDLKLNLIKRINPKYLANDFYYLSTGSTITNYVSGLLFTVSPLTGAPTLNLLNRQYPTVATIPNLSSIYAAYELGRFFLPQFTGLLIHNTPNKEILLDVENLKPNTLYAFPDPKIIGDVSFNSNADYDESPFIYRIDVSWNKVSRSNNYRFAEVLSNSYNPLYYGYQSETQDLQRDYEGLSRTSDNLQFWEGEFQDVWSDSNSWPGLDVVEKLPLEERQASLLTGEYNLIQWACDKFGNEYGLYKQAFSLKLPEPLSARNILLPSGHTEYVNYTPFEDTKINQRKNVLGGKLYFRDINTNIVYPASAALSGIFLKYPENIRNQFASSVIKFNVYYDTFVAETKDYVIIDTIDYNFSSGKIINTNIPSSYFNKTLSDVKLEKYVGNWFAEEENALYIGFLRLLPHLSASNYRAIYPVIYRSNIPNIKFNIVYPGDNIDIFKTYSLSSNGIDIPEIDLFKTESAFISKVSKNELFNLTYLSKNRNGMPYIVNEQFGRAEPYLKSYSPKLFKPFYYNLDNNYANFSLPFYVKYNSPSSRIVGTHNNSQYFFDVGIEDKNYVVYYFKDSIEPVQINSLGHYVIQFDWESYNSANIFIGCNLFNVRLVENNLIWNNSLVLSSYDETYQVSEFTVVNSYIPNPSGVDNFIPLFTGSTQYSINSGNTSIKLNSLTSNLTSYFVQDDEFQTLYGKIIVSIDDTSAFYEVISSNNLDSIIFSPGAHQDVVAGSTVTFYASSLFLPVFNTIKAFVKRPVYPDPSVLDITFTTAISSFTGYFCDSPNSIYKVVEVIKSGVGTGEVFTDPFCIDCLDGNNCSEIFAVGTNLTVIASASYLSVFDGWESYVCIGTDDCTFSVTDNTSITANFGPAPVRTLTIDPGVGFTTTSDGSLATSAYEIKSNTYKFNTVILLSSTPAPSGFFFTGYRGGPCEFGPYDRRTFCLFSLIDNYSISATYVPIEYWDLNLDVVNVFENKWNTPFGRVVSIPVGIDCTGSYDIADVGSCSATFIGGPQYPLFTVLSAKPEKGWRFKRWVGNLLDNIFDNPVQFNLTSNVNVSAEFDLGYFNVNVVTIGGGVCRTFSTNPLGIDCVTPTGGIDSSGCSYQFLSGTTVSIESVGLPGNTVTSLFGPDGQVIVQPLTFNLTDNITISAECINGVATLLTVQNNLSSCYTITANPGPLLTVASTVTGYQRLIRFYPQSSYVTLVVTPTGNSTTCLPFSGFYGENLSYRFGPGRGIRMTTSNNLLSGGTPFSTVNASILFTGGGGAPFYKGQGIEIVAGDAVAFMSDNLTVSALSF